MITVYRIEKKAYSNDWPSRGALFADGRWHKKGFWIVYSSATVSLARLETLANSVFLPRDRVLLEIRINEGAPIKKLSIADLPDNWMKVPYPPELASLTESFLRSGEFLALRVPSCLCPQEYNYLLYPFHRLFQQSVKLESTAAISFDRRLKNT